MKKFLFVYLLALPFCFSAPVQAAPLTPGYFVTTWDTTKPGTSVSNQIQFVVGCSVPSCDVYWEDMHNATNTGTTTVSTGTNFIAFPVPGTYRVDMSNNITSFTSPDDNHKILSVEQWGSPVWSSTAGMFYLSDNVHIKASDTPNLSQVTDMSYMFSNGPTVDTSISSWNVSHVTNFSHLFADNTAFNQSLNSWSVASATTMAGMFLNATAFNQPVSSWATTNVTDMSNAFKGTTHFTQDVSAWNYSAATNMSSFLEGTHLSGVYQDALLQKWASSSLQTGVTTNIGLYALSATGETNRLLVQSRDSWTINYLQSITYTAGTHATLIGSGSQTGLPGQSGSSIHVVPDSGCTFVRWSDEDPLATSTGAVRSDVFATSTLAFSAIIDCPVASSNSSTSQHHTVTSTLILIPATTSETTTTWNGIPPFTTNPAAVTDPETLRTLVALLKQLLEAIAKLTAISAKV